MTNEELLDRVKENVKYMKILSYIQLAISVPLLLKNLLLIFVVLATLFLVYQCRKLSKCFDEFEKNFENDQLYLAEDSLDESGRSLYIISVLSFLLLFAIICVLGLNRNPWYCYLIVSIILYIPYIPLSRFVEPAIKSFSISLRLYRNSKEGIHEDFYI